MKRSKCKVTPKKCLVTARGYLWGTAEQKKWGRWAISSLQNGFAPRGLRKTLKVQLPLKTKWKIQKRALAGGLPSLGKDVSWCHPLKTWTGSAEWSQLPAPFWKEILNDKLRAITYQKYYRRVINALTFKNIIQTDKKKTLVPSGEMSKERAVHKRKKKWLINRKIQTLTNIRKINSWTQFFTHDISKLFPVKKHPLEHVKSWDSIFPDRYWSVQPSLKHITAIKSS